MNEDSCCVKSKLLGSIREMVFLRPEIETPLAVENYILRWNGWSVENCSSSFEDLTEFVKYFQEWMERKYLKNDSENSKRVHSDEIFNSFRDVICNLVKMDKEYINDMSVTISKFQEVVHLMHKFLGMTHNKCELQKFNVNILKQKLDFLKFQFFLKLYGENNALSAHLKLYERLKDDVACLKKSYKEVIEINNKYDKVKASDEFLGLHKQYKELKKIEKKTELLNKYKLFL